MVRITGLYVLFLTFLILSGCSDTKPDPSISTKWNEKSTVIDSVEKYAALVNSAKASDNPKARTIAAQAYAYALKEKSPEAIVKAMVLMGISNTNYNSDTSFHYYTKALRLANERQFILLKPEIHYNLSQIYQSVFDSKRALFSLDSVILYSVETGNFTMLSNAYNAMGNLKFDMLDSVNARTMFDSAYAIARRYSLSRQTGIALASLSKFEYNPVTSALLQKKAIDYLKVLPGNEEEIALILINLGLQTTNPDSSISYFQTAIRMGQTAGSEEVQIAAYNNLAYCYLDKHDLEKADECLSKYAIPLARKQNNYDWLSTLFDSYAEVLLAGNKIAKALAFEREALKARKNADHLKASEQVRLLTSLLDLKNKEIQIQVREIALHEKESKLQTMSTWFAISAILFILILFTVIWVLQRNKIKYQEKLLASAKRLLEIEENLKGRVAMELHDLATPFYTNMLQQIEKAQILDLKIETELKTKLSVLTSSLREISHRMSTTFIEQLTLAELVRGLCVDLRQITQIPIRCVITKENFRLSGEETLHLYRIIQELLTNAIKYVKKGEISISLSEEAKMFYILYQDTGDGFDMDKLSNKGLGISNVFERAKIINGKAILNSYPGKGTKWTIFIPLKPEKKVHYEKALT